MPGMIVVVIYAVAITWAGLASSVKRWHDPDKSGWWVLIGLIPVIRGDLDTGRERLPQGDGGGQNRFGPDPLISAS